MNDVVAIEKSKSTRRMSRRLACFFTLAYFFFVPRSRVIEFDCVRFFVSLTPTPPERVKCRVSCFLYSWKRFMPSPIILLSGECTTEVFHCSSPSESQQLCSCIAKLLSGRKVWVVHKPIQWKFLKHCRDYSNSSRRGLFLSSLLVRTVDVS